MTMALVNESAAVLVKNAEATQKLISETLYLIKDNNKLSAFSQNILKIAEKDSAERIADEIIKIAQ